MTPRDFVLCILPVEMYTFFEAIANHDDRDKEGTYEYFYTYVSILLDYCCTNANNEPAPCMMYSYQCTLIARQRGVGSGYELLYECVQLPQETRNTVFVRPSN